MSTNRLSHLKEGEKIYLEVTRKYGHEMSEMPLLFKTTDHQEVWIDDDDTFYTLDDLKKLANDGVTNGNMPKQDDEIFVIDEDITKPRSIRFISFYRGSIIGIDRMGKITRHMEWEILKKKTELTLAEVEERLGLDAGSLIIK